MATGFYLDLARVGGFLVKFDVQKEDFHPNNQMG